MHLNAWQICPLGPTSFGNSPYQSLSELALNPLFIDMDDLYKRGWISPKTLNNLKGTQGNVRYDTYKAKQQPALLQAYEVFTQQPNESFESFKQQQGRWVEIFATFCSLKIKFDERPWWEWPKEFQCYTAKEVQNYRKSYRKMIDFYIFQQWLLSDQWKALHDYAQKQGITLIGDIPLYIGLDSATVWESRILFDWDMVHDRPKHVAGVPPDYFSKDGQLWGNPLYRWNYHSSTGFQWWIQRIRKNFEWCDVLRLDHFRGLYDFWAVPYGEKTAQKGQWCPGPQKAFFDALKQQWPHMPFILEDLGDLHKEVRDFQSSLNIPGMAILQFAFSDDNNPYLPCHWSANQVVYTGTHDNNTSRGWYSQLSKTEKSKVCSYLGKTKITSVNISAELIRWGLQHCSTQHFIVPAQDLLNLDASARTNIPGTIGANWQWRFHETDWEKFEEAIHKITDNS